ncbi:zinc metalloprotease [Agaricicola taiwanensis]|uniref:Zinc metalloprotease n=1 Tax=Agaricicola taiwanensis TaxID=591372 RepID=A0A8J2YIG8_9RHOB|nr:RIP metalloprotease RseP [Agaricicola taiwanensis]GGE44354.1 zinc metalloprotease [Agaricicola taiwanensis]
MIENISGFVGSAFGYLIPFLLVLTVVIFIHELGHFLVARWAGVRVLVFSIGFGPELLGRTDRHGTRWRIAAIPLGGYVRFLGDANAASGTDHEAIEQMSDRARSETFAAASLPRRAAIVAAGPFANFILAVALFAGIFAFVGRPVTDARIDTVQEGSPAATAGFQPGDIILSINGDAISSFAELQRVVSSNADRALGVTVQRSDGQVQLNVTPERREVEDGFGNKMNIGVLGITRSFEDGDIQRVYAGPVEAVKLGMGETWFVVTRTLDYIGGLFSGRESTDQLSGPIRIAQVSGQAATVGAAALIQLMAVLSVSIGLLNLFPIPMLDGGHLVFYAIEAVRGRPLSERIQEYGMRIGVALVLMLMIVATSNDIAHLWSL